MRARPGLRRHKVPDAAWAYRSARDGSFRFEGVMPGKYEMNVNPW